MNKKQTEAYGYYKRLYPGVVVLYHISDDYVALGDDAVTVAHCLNVDAEDVFGEFRFPYGDVGIISRLGDSLQLKMIDYRNRDGDLDYPDVQKLKEEKYEDY